MALLGRKRLGRFGIFRQCSKLAKMFSLQWHDRLHMGSRQPDDRRGSIPRLRRSPDQRYNAQVARLMHSKRPTNRFDH